MKREEVIMLIKNRLEQAQTALADAQFLSDGNRTVRRVSSIVHTMPCSMPPWP